MYHHILLATDMSVEGKKVAQAACEFSIKFDAKLSLVHIVEQTGFYFGLTEKEVNNSLMENAQKKMEEFVTPLNIPLDDCHLKIGSAKKEIFQLAKKLDIDLIIIGSHGIHGLTSVLGGTANTILHGAKCDVTVVRTHKKK